MRGLIETHYPDHGILGEEYGAKDGKSAFTWILDPVDGTRAFICGMPTWATLIGLNQKANPDWASCTSPCRARRSFGNPDGAWLDYRGATRPFKCGPAPSDRRCNPHHHRARTLPERHRKGRSGALKRAPRA